MRVNGNVIIIIITLYHDLLIIIIMQLYIIESHKRTECGGTKFEESSIGGG